ncbi:MAG: serine/threonine-protein kinase [Pseudomonadota bacterium]
MAQHGRYTVVRKLANGGMAEIFLASQQGHEGFQKPVVLKRILGTIYADPQFRNMLIDEAHISMSLTHSNIVQVLDLGLAGGRYFLVLELIDGWDLGHILQRAKGAGLPLPPALGLFIVTEVCRALAYAHSKRGMDGQPLGIVHRDVSPNNVLISEHGEVKLADFGIAKAMNKREHTGTGVVKGKVAFMSPEQGLGKPIDGRSDVFSLGTLLYVLSVGVRPFEATTDLETLLRVQRADFKQPNRVRPDLQPELAAVIARAMKFSPDDRYQTADEMLLDLERLLRADHGGVGQTEMKHYLADLGRRDGVPPIGRAVPVLDDDASRSGVELVEGNAVVLADAQDDMAAERTDLAEFAMEGDSAPRFTRRTVDLGRMGGVDSGGLREMTPSRAGRRGLDRVDLMGREPTPPRSTRRLVEELSIPEGAVEEGPPGRYRRKKSRAVPTFFFLLVVGGGGYAAARYFGWTDMLITKLDLAGKVAPTAEPAATPPPPPPDEPAPAPAVKALPPRSAKAASPSPAAAPPPPAPEAPAGPEGRDQAAEGAGVPPPAAGAPSEAASEGNRSPAAGGARPDRASTGKARSGGSRDVFKDSARRVRSLSQGLDQLPPGTIQLPPPTPDPGAPAPAPTPP